MTLHNELFIVIVALLIVAGICLGLLVALVVFTLGRRGSSPSPTSDIATPVNRSKRIASLTTAMTVSLVAIAFSATLVPIEQNWVIATILLVVGLIVGVLSWIQFRRT